MSFSTRRLQETAAVVCVSGRYEEEISTAWRENVQVVRGLPMWAELGFGVWAPFSGSFKLLINCKNKYMIDHIY